MNEIFPAFKELYDNTSGLIHFSSQHLQHHKRIQVEGDKMRAEILFNGEHFFSLPQKVDYGYNLYLVSYELYKLLKGYTLFVKELMEQI